MRVRLPARGGRALIAALAAVAVALALTLLLVVDRDGDPRDRRQILGVVDERRLGPRLLEFTTRTASLDRDVPVRVLLPADYEGTDRSFPVLYLLHPAGGDPRFWTETMRIAELAEGLPLIIVMPDGGKVGFYTDWRQAGDRPSPQWETYHVEQLIPWVDSEFRTVDGREGRAVAGVSMGGLGALIYAGRHPDLFAAAASLSGPVELKPRTMLDLFRVLRTGPALAERIWGPDVGLEPWADHDPVALAFNYRELDVILRTGDGRPEGYDGPLRDPIEVRIHKMNASLHRRLSELGIPHVWAPDVGAHNASQFRQETARTLPELMDVIEADGR